MKFVNPLNETEIATLQSMHRYHPSRRARMRAHCLLLSHQRYCLTDIAQLYHVSRRRVSAWINRWHACGLAGLYDQPRSGRPPIYSEEEQQHVDHYLQRYPQARSYPYRSCMTSRRKPVGTYPSSCAEAKASPRTSFMARPAIFPSICTICVVSVPVDTASMSCR